MNLVLVKEFFDFGDDDAMAASMYRALATKVKENNIERIDIIQCPPEEDQVMYLRKRRLIT